MSSLLLPPAPAPPTDEKPPELVNGDRLTNAEFMRRYEAMPGVTAELINGVVFIMPSPVRHTQHGGPIYMLLRWLGAYCDLHPELIPGTNSTTFLGEGQIPQPDGYLIRPVSAGGNASIDESGYIHGPAEVVCEVAASPVSVDANAKADMYAEAGVKEYLLWRTAERPEPTIDWFQLRDDGLYHPLEPDADGVIESVVFPGLRLDRPALLRGDLPAVLAAVSAE
ncbi:MAG: Uma2 family endonuclease [Planctomycetota bacterium]